MFSEGLGAGDNADWPVGLIDCIYDHRLANCGHTEALPLDAAIYFTAVQCQVNLTQILLDVSINRQVALTVTVPATRPPGELQKRAAALIIGKLETISISQAARDLKVSRQSIYDYKDGKFCPCLAVIRRACAAWELEFEVYGMKVSEQTLNPKLAQEPPPPVQLNFFDLWAQLQDQKMTVVRAENVNGAVEMTLRISIPA